MTSKKIYLLFYLPFFALWIHGTPEASAQRALPNSDMPKICADPLMSFNLPQELEVRMNEKQPEVFIDWSRTEGEDPYLSTKIDTFFRFLQTEPKLGQEQAKNLFASYFYEEVSHSSDQGLKESFDTALKETLKNSQALAHRNIQMLYHDYYPYLFVDEFKQNPLLAAKVKDGLSQVLQTPEWTVSELLKAVGSQLKEMPGQGEMKKTISCFSQVVDHKALTDFIPGQPSSVYGRQDQKMKELVEVLKKEQKGSAILTSLTHDTDLAQATQTALSEGSQALLKLWADNSNIQNLLQFYEQGPTVNDLVDTFFQSSLGKNVDRCVRDGYGENLLPRVQDLYVKLLKNELANQTTCSHETTEVVFGALQPLFSPAQPKNIRDEAMKITMAFIQDYLSLESKLSVITGASAPFNTHYKDELATLFNYPQQMSIDIYRDGTLIHQETNTNLTQFIDRSVPANSSGKTKYHQYYIISRTACDTKVGSAGRAVLPTELPSGTPVKMKLNLAVKLHDHQETFMQRLHLLLKDLDVKKNSSSDLSSSENQQESQACVTQRNLLMKQRTSQELIDYVMACFGDEQINSALQHQAKDFLNPLIRFLQLNDFVQVDELTGSFLAPLLEQARQEYELHQTLLSKIIPLKAHAKELSSVKTLDALTEAQKNLIMCGGYEDCPMEIKNMIENYFKGVGHAAELLLEVQDVQRNTMFSQKARTNLFGEIQNVDMGTLKTGPVYELKISLVSQPYALAKRAPIFIQSVSSDAKNENVATLEIETHTPFFYGNFENTDEQIDYKDVQAWSRLLEKHPEQWSFWDIDGFNGADLADAQSLQSKTKDIPETSTGSEKSVKQILEILGGKSENETLLYTPEWLKKSDQCN